MRKQTSKPVDPAIVVAKDKVEAFFAATKGHTSADVLARAQRHGATPNLYKSVQV